MNTRFFNPEIETMPQEDLRALQSDRLRSSFCHVYENNALRRIQFGVIGLHPADVRSLDDLSRIPLMSGDDLRRYYPLELSCVVKAQVAAVLLSPATSGRPVVMPCTAADLEQWAECLARCIVMAGGIPGGVFQMAASTGLFDGGIGFFLGARKAGLSLLPPGETDPARLARLARDFSTTIMTGSVSSGVRLAEAIQTEGLELPALRAGLFGGETLLSDPVRKKIERALGIEIFQILGIIETGGAGTLGMECPEHAGIHIWEDQVLIEIIDRETGRPLPDGETGELVVTSLTREALPVLRFRTGSLARVLSRDPCPCGRTLARLAPLAGLTD